ncbi:MAG: hypothetical protein M1834_008747 [Cirrosporium novae-zelandiae]|nr:MAG: hypothetical protein M1834_008747 [Cirrosporium novae-zelandiae]
MPPQQLSTPFRTQSLCIFCAAALELEASIGPRAWTLGRRTLKTSTTAYKPPAYATAEVEDQDRDSWDNTPLPADPSSGSWGKPSSTSSWASNSFTVKLSPEEQRQKQASAQHTVPTPTTLHTAVVDSREMRSSNPNTPKSSRDLLRVLRLRKALGNAQVVAAQIAFPGLNA